MDSRHDDVRALGDLGRSPAGARRKPASTIAASAAGASWPRARTQSNGALALGLAVGALLILVLAVSVVSLIDHPPGDGRDYGMAGKIPG